MGTSTIDFSKYEEKPQIDFSKYESAPISGGKTEGRNLIPFSAPSTAGKTIGKVASASVSPNFIGGGVGANHPEWSEYQWGVANEILHGPMPTNRPYDNGFKRFLRNVLGESNSRTTFSPQNQQEQSEYDQVQKALSEPGSFGKHLVDELKKASPVVLNKEQWQQDPNEALSSSLANLIMLRQGLKIPKQAAIAEAKAQPAPNVFEGTPPEQIPAAGATGTRNLSEIPSLLKREVVGRVPFGSRLGLPKKPTIREYFDALRKQPTERPVLDPAENAARGPYEPYQGDLTVQPGEPLEVIPAERQAGSPPVTATQPKTSQVLKASGVTQAMKEAGIAAPSASMRGVRPGVTGSLAPRADIQFPPGLSGEDASLMQLTRYNINELRFMATKRGLPVAAKDTHAALIDKIQNSLTPEETAGFSTAAQASKVTPSQFPENNLMADLLNQEADSLQAARENPYRIATLRNAASKIRQYPETLSNIDFAATKIRGIDKGLQRRISEFMTDQKAVPADEAPTVAYRVRDAGDKGIMPKGHAQATTDLGQAKSYVSGRGSAQNAPQEVVKVDLTKLKPSEYTLVPGPGGKTWVRFKGAVPESFIEKVGDQPEVPTDATMEDLLRRSIQRAERQRAAKAGDD